MDTSMTQLIQLIFSIVVTLVGLLLKRYFENKLKLIAFYGHASENTLKNLDGLEFKNENGQRIDIRTHSVYIVNIGTLAAKNVRVVHNFLPINFSIYPPVEYKVIGNEIVIPSLIAGEQINISYLYFPPIHVSQIHALIKSDECLSVPGNMKHVQVLPAWIKVMTYILLFVGIVTTIYLATSLALHFNSNCFMPN